MEKVSKNAQENITENPYQFPCRVQSYDGSYLSYYLRHKEPPVINIITGTNQEISSQKAKKKIT